MFKKVLLTSMLAIGVYFTGINTVMACGNEAPLKEGKQQEITTIQSVDYQESAKQYFFITADKGTGFWVLDYKQESFNQAKFNQYRKELVGKQVTIDFTVKGGDVDTFTYTIGK